MTDQTAQQSNQPLQPPKKDNKKAKDNAKAERRRQKVEQRGNDQQSHQHQHQKSYQYQQQSQLQPSNNFNKSDDDLRSQISNSNSVKHQSQFKSSITFKHLERRPPPIQKSENVHPSIAKLGSLLSNFSIVGANARTIALMAGLKTVIKSYITPPGTTLSRNLLSFISPQITHLESCRPKTLSNGSAIRWLKLQIANIDPDMDENNAKQHLCMLIDLYVRDRLTLADQKVTENVLNHHFKNFERIVVYGRSSIVEKTLIEAKNQGKKFNVIVVDSAPLFEGKKMLINLVKSNIDCTYGHLNALPSLIQDATLTLLGTHAILSNGSIYSRVGTSGVALISNNFNVNTLILGESYKFVDKIMLDSITTNELTPLKYEINTTDNVKSENILYDVTPAKLINKIVTEVGILQPNAISDVMFRGRSQHAV